MSEASALTLSHPSARPRLARLSPGFAANAAIVVAAIVLQTRLGTVDDVSWLITVAEKWLGGGELYVDVIEVNPPASILIYAPAVALAHALALRPEFVVAAFGFATIAVSLALGRAILRRAGFIGGLDAPALGLALVALTILPARAFDERDMLAAVLGLPFLALAAARAEGDAVDWRHALLAGLGAGAMAALKPPYALVLVAPGLWLILRRGWRAVFAAPEYWAAAALGLVYVAAVPIAFPAYLATMMPFNVAVYARLRAPLLELIGQPGSILGVTMAFALVKIAGARLRSPLVAALALGALGAFGAYLVQGKGWLYQLYPAMLYVALAIAAVGGSRAPTRLLALAVVAALAAALVLVLERLPLPIALASALAGWALAERFGLARDGSGDGLGRLAEFGVAAALGVSTALFASEGLREPVLARALAALGPHPTVAALSPTLAFSHPLVRDVGGVWAQRGIGLMQTAAALRLIDEHPHDANLRDKVAPFIRAEHDMLVEDLRRNRPDALLVGRLGSAAVEQALADPDIAAARADYVLVVENGDRDWPAALYVRKDLVRKDLVGLRPSLPVSAPPRSGE